MSKTAIDIGANVGLYTAELLKHYDKIICVEPISSHYQLLKEKFSSSNVEILNCLVSSKEGVIPFYECDTISTVEPSWIANSRFSKNYTWKNPVLTQSITLDSIIEKYGQSDFIKIDVEGHEFAVLQGLTKIFPEIIAFEWAIESIESTISCIAYLKEKNYIEFYIQQYSDSYLEPEQISWRSYVEILSEINKEVKLKELNWGMVWAKKYS